MVKIKQLSKTHEKKHYKEVELQNLDKSVTASINPKEERLVKKLKKSKKKLLTSQIGKKEPVRDHNIKVSTFNPKKTNKPGQTIKNPYLICHKTVQHNTPYKKKLSQETTSHIKDPKFSSPSEEFCGDISEEDIDSDDNLSLDENELPAPPDVTTTEEETSEDEECADQPIDVLPPTEEKEDRTVFVGNLPKSVSKCKLKKWFKLYGTVESVRLRCAPLSDPTIPKRLAIIKKAFHEERSNIHGYVRFSNDDEAKNALSANGQLFGETHYLRVDMAGDAGHRKYDDKKAIFVGNLPFSAEEDQLRDNFADCGDIISIRIVRDKHTAVGKGFAFINFAARHSVRLALEKDGLELIGRKLRVQKACYNEELKATNENKNLTQRQNRTIIRKTNIFPSTKIKKKGKNISEDQGFQGTRSNKNSKSKKFNRRKKKLKFKREKLKNLLSSEKKL